MEEGKNLLLWICLSGDWLGDSSPKKSADSSGGNGLCAAVCVDDEAFGGASLPGAAVLHAGNLVGAGEFRIGANLRRNNPGTKTLDSGCQGCGSRGSADCCYRLRGFGADNLFSRRVSQPTAKDPCRIPAFMDHCNSNDSHRWNVCFPANKEITEQGQHHISCQNSKTYLRSIA